MDVSNRFSHGELYEEVYMQFSQGYSDYDCRVSVNAEPVSAMESGKVCKLLKSLIWVETGSCLQLLLALVMNNQKLILSLHKANYN